MSLFSREKVLAPKRDTSILMRFLTLGGATVELRADHFTTRWHPLRGCPDIVVKPYEVDGFTWECLGCDTVDRGNGRGYGKRGYLPRDRKEARDDANEHADTCRSMPKSGVSR